MSFRKGETFCKHENQFSLYVKCEIKLQVIKELFISLKYKVKKKDFFKII